MSLNFTSNWISRLFFCGHAKGGIEKIGKANFFKAEKAAAFQLRCLPAVEAKPLSLKAGILIGGTKSYADKDMTSNKFLHASFVLEKAV